MLGYSRPGTPAEARNFGDCQKCSSNFHRLSRTIPRYLIVDPSAMVVPPTTIDVPGRRDSSTSVVSKATSNTSARIQLKVLIRPLWQFIVFISRAFSFNIPMSHYRFGLVLIPMVQLKKWTRTKVPNNTLFNLTKSLCTSMFYQILIIHRIDGLRKSPKCKIYSYSLIRFYSKCDRWFH